MAATKPEIQILVLELVDKVGRFQRLHACSTTGDITTSFFAVVVMLNLPLPVWWWTVLRMKSSFAFLANENIGASIEIIAFLSHLQAVLRHI